MSSTARRKAEIKRREYLISAIDKVYPPLKTLMIRSFIQGICIGLGTTIGAGIIISAVTFILSKLNILTHVSLFK